MKKKIQKNIPDCVDRGRDIDSHSLLFRFVVKDRGGTSDNSMVLGSCAGYDGSHP